MDPFTYRGRPVLLNRYTDIPHEMRPGGKYAGYVRKVLEDIPPWDEDERFPWGELHFPSARIFPMAVKVSADTPRTWGIHRGHKARKPGLSPFVDLWVEERLLGWVTAELVDSPDKLLLTRAYGGKYTPPLPWMVSAHQAIGGREACLEYWQTHAYLSRGLRLIKPETMTTEAPEWFAA